MTTQTLLLILVQSALSALLTTGLVQRWLEHYKSELTLALGRITRFDEKEFTTLEEAWAKTCDAVTYVGEVLRQGGGSEHDRSTAAATLAGLHDFLIDADVYLPAGLRAHLLELDYALGEAVLDLTLGLHCRDDLLREQGFRLYRDRVLPTYQVLREELRSYLRQHRESKRTLLPSHSWLRLWAGR